MIPIPLRTTERLSATAAVTISLIVVNLCVFLFELQLRPADYQQFVEQWGIVPDHLRGSALITLFTSMFLHAGWLHVLGNMLYLWVFGRNIEDLIGGVRFLLFYILCGMIAGVVHVIFNSSSVTPTIGASGAIAGVMGAFLIKFPRARIITLTFIIFFVTTLEIPAPLLLILWFAGQFFSGVGSLGDNDYTGGGTAYFAHIGGFLAGMLLIRLFPAKRKWRAWYDEE
jgi:membrane associated rhomboid family serine protease